jgi:hypothetical protein
MALYGLGSMLGSGVYGLIGQATVLLLLLVFAFLNGARLAGIFVLYAAVAAEN